jgi:hypothetical protein
MVERGRIPSIHVILARYYSLAMASQEAISTSAIPEKSLPVFLAAPGNQAANPAFIERKIQLMFPGPVSDVSDFVSAKVIKYAPMG